MLMLGPFKYMAQLDPIAPNSLYLTLFYGTIKKEANDTRSVQTVQEGMKGAVPLLFAPWINLLLFIFSCFATDVMTNNKTHSLKHKSFPAKHKSRFDLQKALGVRQPYSYLRQFLFVFNFCSISGSRELYSDVFLPFYLGFILQIR